MRPLPSRCCRGSRPRRRLPGISRRRPESPSTRRRDLPWRARRRCRKRPYCRRPKRPSPGLPALRRGRPSTTCRGIPRSTSSERCASASCRRRRWPADHPSPSRAPSDGSCSKSDCRRPKVVCRSRASCPARLWLPSSDCRPERPYRRIQAVAAARRPRGLLPLFQRALRRRTQPGRRRSGRESGI